MRRFLLALLVPLSVSAQPSCWPDASLAAIVARDDAPVQIGQIAVRASAVGMVWGYSCRRSDGGVTRVIAGGPWSSWAPDWPALALAALRGADEDRAALWRQYVTAGTIDARLQPDIDALKARLPPPSAPPPATGYIVAPTSICAAGDKDTSGRCVRRQTYVWSGGARGLPAPEKADIGAPCDIGVGAAGFYGVLGRTDRVAPCVRP